MLFNIQWSAIFYLSCFLFVLQIYWSFKLILGKLEKLKVVFCQFLSNLSHICYCIIWKQTATFNTLKIVNAETRVLKVTLKSISVLSIYVITLTASPIGIGFYTKTMMIVIELKNWANQNKPCLHSQQLYVETVFKRSNKDGALFWLQLIQPKLKLVIESVLRFCLKHVVITSNETFSPSTFFVLQSYQSLETKGIIAWNQP